MKKIILIIFIFFIYKFNCILQQVQVEKKVKTTASTGVKAATKFDIGKKWVSKAKKFEKKNKQAKAKNAYEKAIKKFIRGKFSKSK